MKLVIMKRVRCHRWKLIMSFFARDFGPRIMINRNVYLQGIKGGKAKMTVFNWALIYVFAIV